jgi:hypothetical protein
VVKTGETPVLGGKEWWRIIDAIPTETLRDRALMMSWPNGPPDNRVNGVYCPNTVFRSLAFLWEEYQWPP